MTKSNQSDHLLEAKTNHLLSILKAQESTAVCFSGGTDSTFLLYAAKTALRDRVIAITARSATFSNVEMDAAKKICHMLDVPHVIVETTEMQSITFTANSFDRCYHCKKIRLGQLIQTAKKQNMVHLMDGENMDDARDYRPGRLASDELGILHPLRLAGLTKSEIRELSRQAGLLNWNQPANACLASRIPYGQAITPEKLNRIDQCELFLRSLGISPVIRVRHDDAVARIEVAPIDLAKIVDETLRRRIILFFKENGFHSVTMDLEGYRTGSLNNKPPTSS
jgi:uncharacterized protein